MKNVFITTILFIICCIFVMSCQKKHCYRCYYWANGSGNSRYEHAEIFCNLTKAQVNNTGFDYSRPCDELY
jgi:hypothetical protein